MSTRNWSWKPHASDLPAKRAAPKKRKAKGRKWWAKHRRFREVPDIVPEGARSHVRSIQQEGRK